MNPDVGLQRALGCKTLSTDLAGERLLSWKEEKLCVHKLSSTRDAKSNQTVRISGSPLSIVTTPAGTSDLCVHLHPLGPVTSVYTCTRWDQ